MKTTSAVLAAVVLALAGCGEDDSTSSRKAPREGGSAATETGVTRTAQDPAPEGGARAPAGTRITLAGSEFGPMLFDANQQAIYVFERDARAKTVCYGECAEAWPPVYTEGKPRGGRGVRESLLGTVKRRDGRRQVTYAGRPLYFYAHEGRGEVRCHNVNLNGGLWWVVGPDGRPRP